MRRVFRIPFSRSRIDREIDDELAFHLETRVERLVAGGLSSDAARAEALRQFGDVAQTRQSMALLDQQRERATRRRDYGGEMQQDVTFALRTLRRNAGVSAVIIGLLATGIGANTAIFTVVDATLLRSIPVHRPEQLVIVGNPSMANSAGSGMPRTDAFSAPLYQDVRDRNQVFSGVLASGGIRRIDVRVDPSSSGFERAQGRWISGNYFSVLGVPALRGRTFDATVDAVAGTSSVVVISHAYWMRRFNGDPAAIGRTITVFGQRMTIIGVTPPSFTGEVVGEYADMWLPLSMHDVLRPNDKILTKRSESWLLLIGRLKPGATVAQAQAQIKPLIEASILANAAPRVAAEFNKRPHVYAIMSGARGLSVVRDDFATPLLTLMVGVGLVLCIVCANVANLLLARAIARGREMAVRLALGADRRRLLRQLMTENVVLALLSAMVGLAVAWAGSRGLVALAADGDAIPLDLHMDIRILSFTIGLSVIAVGLFGLAPALHASRIELAAALRSAGRAISAGSFSARGRRAPLGGRLLAAQIALSVVLLAGATLFARSLRNIEAYETGMDREHLAMASVDVESRGYSHGRLNGVVREIRARLAALPGVAAVSMTENGLFTGTDWSTAIQIPGFVSRAEGDTVVGTDQVGTGYAHTIGARIVAGRDIGAEDEDRPPRTVLVNETMANYYFPHGDAVGRYIHMDDTVSFRIIGVMADVRNRSLAVAPRRRIYYPLLHAEDTVNVGGLSSLRFAVRTTGNPAALVQPIRQTIASVDPELPIDRVDTMMSLMRATIREERLIARVATAFGALALALAAIGLYGVMAYAITRRTGEIGLRIALGAQRTEVVRMVIGDALRLVAAGVVVGAPLAVASGRLVRAQLHDVAPLDITSIAVAVGVLTVSALIAVALPAMRAARVSPIEALRGE